MRLVKWVISLVLVFVCLGGCSNSTSQIAYEEALSSGRPTVVEFVTSACPACVEMKPIIEDLRETYEGKLNILVLDSSRNRSLSARFTIRYVPTFILFDQAGDQLSFVEAGNIVDRHVGYWPKQDFVACLTELGMV